MRFLVQTMLFVLLVPASALASLQDALERKVGTDANGHPVRFTAFPRDLGPLSGVVSVPMGAETLPPSRPGSSLASVVLTGLTLREALDGIVRRDPRYEWRNVDGVIVFRPADAWNQSAGHTRGTASPPLSQAIPEVRLGETSTQLAANLVAALLGAPHSSPLLFSDTSRLVINAETGTIFDLLNVIAKAHGNLVWEFRHERPGAMFPYTLLFFSGDHGGGIGVKGRATQGVDLRRFMAASDETSSVSDRIVGLKPNGSPLVLNGWGGGWPLWELSSASRVPMGIELEPDPTAPATLVPRVQGHGPETP